jgi:predicted nucleic acid-binding protein
MRVVVDTNVLVSAVLKDKSVPALAVHWLELHGGLLKSAMTEQQPFAVIARPRLAGLIAPTARDWLHRVMAAAEPVVTSVSSRAVIRPMTSSSNWRSTGVRTS